VKEKDFGIHLIGLYAMLIFGQAGVLLPYRNADEYTFTGFMLSVIFNLIFMIIWFPLVKHMKLNQETAIVKKLIFSLIYIIIVIISVSTLIDNLTVFTEFINIFVLSETPKYIIALLFIFTVIYITLSRIEAFYKFTFLAFVVSSVIIVILFLVSIPRFDIKNIIILSFPKLKNLYEQALPFFKNISFSVLILPFFHFLVAEKTTKKHSVYGVIAGNILIIFTLLNSVLIFGSRLAGKIEYPYSEAIGTVTVGDIFTRMDGFSYFVFFFSCLTEACVCILIIKKTAELLYKAYFSKNSKGVAGRCHE